MKIGRSLTKFFIPFQIKENSESEGSEIEPDGRIWERLDPYGSEIGGMTKKLIPSVTGLFRGKIPGCRVYKLSGSNDLDVRQLLLGDSYQIGDTSLQFSFEEVQLFLFPKHSIGIFVIEIDPEAEDMDELLDINHKLRVFEEGRIPEFSKGSEKSEDWSEEIWRKKLEGAGEKPGFLDDDYALYNRVVLWEDQNGEIKFGVDEREELLKTLHSVHGNGIEENEDRIVYPKFSFKSICEILCGELISFKEVNGDMYEGLNEFWRRIRKTGRLPGLVYVSADYGDEEKDVEQEQRDLFHLRHFYNRNYVPSGSRLQFRDNPEIMDIFEDVKVGVSYEGVAMLDEKKGSKGGMDFYGNARKHYSTMVLMSLMLRWRLIDLSERLIELRNLARERGRKEDYKEDYKEDLEDLRNEVMDFDISTSSSQISEVTHINQIYKSFNKLLGTEDYFTELKRSIETIDEFLRKKRESAENKRLNLLAIVIGIFGIWEVLTTIAFHYDTTPLEKIGILGVIPAIGILLVLTYYYT